MIKTRLKKTAKLFISFGICFLFTQGAFTQEALAKELYSSTIPELTQQIIARSFPELQNKTIAHHTFNSAEGYFESNVEVSTLFGGPVTYLVNYNPRVFEQSCPEPAIEAILAHELSHTLDYVKGGIPALLGVLNAIRLPLSNQRYERHTDLQAIFRGYGTGLIAYRHWIYKHLNPTQLRRKQKTYYTPAEIQLIMSALKAAEAKGLRAMLEARLLNEVPLNTKALLDSLKPLKSGMVKGL